MAEDSWLIEFAGDVAALTQVPGSSAATKKALKACVDERARRRSVAIRAAEERFGGTREELAARLQDDPRLVSLLIRLLYALGVNGCDDALRAMGSALGDAAREPHRAGDIELIMQVVVDLTAEHISVLRVIKDRDPSRDPTLTTGGWGIQHIATTSALSDVSLTIVLATLVARGLASTPMGGGYEGGTYLASTLGRTMLDVVDAVRN